MTKGNGNYIYKNIMEVLIMNVTMETCPNLISEITSAINDLIHDYESILNAMDKDMDKDTRISIDENTEPVISPKYLIEYDNLCKKADRIQESIVDLRLSVFLDIENKNLDPNTRATIKFYSMQVDALQGMLDQVTTSMAATEIDYFNRENMMPYIRYYKRMNSKVRDYASDAKSASNKPKSDDVTSLNYIKSRSDRAFHADAVDRFNPNFKENGYETFEV